MRSRKGRPWSVWEPCCSASGFHERRRLPPHTARYAHPGVPGRHAGLNERAGGPVQAAGRRGAGSCYAIGCRPGTAQECPGAAQVFRDRERAMNEALVAAQQLRTDARAQAEREAETSFGRPRGRRCGICPPASRTSGGARAVRIRPRQFAAYIAEFRALLERQLAEIDGSRGPLANHRTDADGTGPSGRNDRGSPPTSLRRRPARSRLRTPPLRRGRDHPRHRAGWAGRGDRGGDRDPLRRDPRLSAVHRREHAGQLLLSLPPLRGVRPAAGHLPGARHARAGRRRWSSPTPAAACTRSGPPAT